MVSYVNMNGGGPVGRSYKERQAENKLNFSHGFFNLNYRKTKKDEVVIWAKYGKRQE